MKIAQVGEPILRSMAKPVTDSEINNAALQTFIDDLMQTMQVANGVGIAAPQVFDERAVMIEYQTREAERVTLRLDGFVARIFLHEYDHLIGKTWLDHVEVNTDIMAESVWRRVIAGIPDEAE